MTTTSERGSAPSKKIARGEEGGIGTKEEEEEEEEEEMCGRICE
jgi:hypothetical protein